MRWLPSRAAVSWGSVGTAALGLCLLTAFSGACADQHDGERAPDRGAAPPFDAGPGLGAGAAAAVHEAGSEEELVRVIREYGCEAARSMVYLAVRQAVQGNDEERCETAADCRLVQGHTSCVGCFWSARNPGSADAVPARVAEVARQCDPYLAAGCPAPDAVQCSSMAYVAACADGRCTDALSACGSGCTPEQGTCRGPAGSACDGCPAVWEEVRGKPCAADGKSCRRDGDGRDLFCASSPGAEPRWLILVPL
jgi:hypothetical protein